MHFNQRKASVARVAALGAVTLGTAATLAAQTHPAVAAGILAAVNSAITCASTGACVSGSNTKSGYGVEGTSKAGYGVFGLSKGTGTGVFGGAQTGWGMFGYSDNNDGVEGVSTNHNGVEGVSYATTSTHAIGVKGSTAGPGSGTGVWGDNNHGVGVLATTNDGYGVESKAIDAFGLPFVAIGNLGEVVFSVDYSGDIFQAGHIDSASRSADGTTVVAYSAKSTSPTVEDTGTAQLVGGSATVLLDPIFARTIDSASSYRVFLTANGDTHGLFVARKTAIGFAVRENQGGRSTVSFDYRIVATALGRAGQRMAVAKPGALRPLGAAQQPSTSASKAAPLPRLP